MVNNEFSLTQRAQYLRKNMTTEELKLWRDCLQSLPVTVNRQRQIGEYIVDFYCVKAKLIIEIDGARHYTEDGKLLDQKRDNYMRSLGLVVMRFSNNETATDFNMVSRTIWNYIEGYIAENANS